MCRKDLFVVSSESTTYGWLLASRAVPPVVENGTGQAAMGFQIGSVGEETLIFGNVGRENLWRAFQRVGRADARSGKLDQEFGRVPLSGPLNPIRFRRLRAAPQLPPERPGLEQRARAGLVLRVRRR